MAEVTRKLLVVEVPIRLVNAKVAWLKTSNGCFYEPGLQRELPSAEELGQIAICTKRPMGHSDSCACAECEKIVGRVILAALTKGAK